MAERKLSILGVGPGDPELLTVKATRLIREADFVFAPVNRGKHRSYDIAADYVREEQLVFLEVPMLEMSDERYEREAQVINERLKDGKTGVYLCLGDAAIYSSAFKLLPYLENDISCQWVAGIPSFLQGFNQCILPLTQKGERFLLLDEWNEESRELAKKVDSLAILKAHRDPERVFKELKEEGFSPVLISQLGLEEEEILTDIPDGKSFPYLSFILARR